ncbi:lipopolysaccharide transport periplasmic protein LptA [Yoonia sp. F2084L]|uniref:lipopolysaccharide transport periplasmic protein LptA n=1 Tax=Yoonia sp. F2084L TaxID=2926419 RepID=UPI001FF4D46B|nr:lipopolysaccharide transport periplasmic protein LptA [Yoonia sp. F2084L]MCK0097519.1 lipopolysaccharide transport periplasmic protein LptA [Yoonia sp. F2084L]
MLRQIALCASLIVATAGMAHAQTNIDLGGITVDTAAAIEVTADSLAVDQETGKAVFDGNVIIGQGDLRLTAGRVEVIYGTDTSQIARLIATGGVTFVTADEAAEAQQADYDITTGLLVLAGDVLLTQGPSAISAGQMTINVADGTATMDGRVRTVLQQGEN